MAFDQPNQQPHLPPPQAQRQQQPQQQPHQPTQATSEEWGYNNSNRYNPGPYPPSSYPRSPQQMVDYAPNGRENYTSAYPPNSWEQVYISYYI